MSLRLLLLIVSTALVASSLTITGSITCKDAPVVGAKLYLRTISARARAELKIDAATDESGKFAVEVPEGDLDLFNAAGTTKHLDYENTCAKSAPKPGCVPMSSAAIPKAAPGKDTIDLGQIVAFMDRVSPVCKKP